METIKTHAFSGSACQEHLCTMGVAAYQKLSQGVPWPLFDFDKFSPSTLKRFAGNAPLTASRPFVSDDCNDSWCTLLPLSFTTFRVRFGSNSFIKLAPLVRCRSTHDAALKKKTLRS